MVAAVAWIFYRPVIGGILLATALVGIGAFVYLRVSMGRRKHAEANAMSQGQYQL